MRFSHISDTHLGFSQYGTDERENDFYHSFNQMIDISIKDRVDFVILTGIYFTCHILQEMHYCKWQMH